MSESYDVVVIGAGPAGYWCAIRARQLGLRAACVENDSYEGGLGGTCLNWGCIPAKALLESAALAQNIAGHGEEMGVRAADIELDMGAAVNRSRGISEKLSGGVKYLFKKNEVDTIMGTGRLAGANKVAIEDSDGKTRILDTKHAVIATGSVMKSFPGFEIDGEKVIGSREALGLRVLPGKMVVVGAGYVGVEFADVFAAFGVEVTVVEALPTLVPLEDPEVGKTLARAYKKRGIEIRTDTMVKELKRDASPMLLTVEGKKGTEEIETDVVLMAIGREPVTAGLGLEDAGVAVEDGFIVIDEWCRTTASWVYAIGDVAGPPMLAHKGSHEGLVAAEHIAGVAEHPMRYDNIPSVGYCHPEIATIGMTEAQAEEAGHEVLVGKYPLTSHGRAITAAANEGFVKIVADAKYGEVLGCQMIGHNVSELIDEVGLGRMLEVTLDEIAGFPHAHPTMSEAIMQAAMAALERAIDI
jgi:dihydrolipoamide dehydrogenase